MTTNSDAPANPGGIHQGSHVTLHFRLTLADGQIVFGTFDDKPATIQIGEGQFAPALEKCLIALREGDERSYQLGPDDGFGPRHPDLVQKVSQSLLDRYADPTDPIAPGDVVEFPTPDQSAIFDFNHPLAGQPLRFDGRIIGLL